MTRVEVLQHVPFEGPASIAEWCHERGHDLRTVHLYRNKAPRPPADVDLLVVMGGPMSVHDTGAYAWLADEKRHLRSAVQSATPVLGICLGAQLLADVLGAEVCPGAHKEIGWWPVETCAQAADAGPLAALPASFDAFHWHGETFDIPPAAVHVASSSACTNQAFVYQRRVVGLQFHLETTEVSARSLIEACADEIVAGPYIQDAEAMLGERARFERSNAIMREVLDAMAGLGASA